MKRFATQEMAVNHAMNEITAGVIVYLYDENDSHVVSSEQPDIPFVAAVPGDSIETVSARFGNLVR